MDAIWIKAFILIISSEIVSAGSVCSPANRTENVDECLVEIKAKLLSKSFFWFGHKYKTQCPNGDDGTLECSNDFPDRDSMITRVFSGGFNLEPIDRYLDVTYETLPGEYSACEYNFMSNTTWVKKLDPVQPEIVSPWFVRMMPNLAWRYDAGEYYTLVVYDIGYLITHAVLINIQGNNMGTATVKDPYHGPLVTTDVENPYIFMIFKQAGYLTLTSEWDKKLITPKGAYTISEFVEAANLTGPIAVNWVVATGDPYAAGLMQSRGFISTCSVFVSRAMNMKARPFLPTKAKLSVWVNVTFSPTDFSFETCCVTYTLKARQFNLNPIGNALFKTSETRSEAPPSFSFLKKGIFNQAANFTGNTYTLVAVDPDVASPSAGTETRPLLHMMYVNIMDGNASTGDVVRVWRGPGPPDALPHYYYFLLYEQQSGSTLNAAQMREYAGDSCKNENSGLPYRCQYDINRMVSENNLTLVGASWMRAQKDEYVIFRNINNLQNKTEDAIDEQCQGQSNYKRGCPTGSAPTTHAQSFAAMSLCFVIACLIRPVAF